jgi:hypothetical protein
MTESFAANACSATARSVILPMRVVAAATDPRALAMASPQRGAQSYFWTPEWQQGEQLAAYDFLIGDVFKPTDAADLINWLHEGS